MKKSIAFRLSGTFSLLIAILMIAFSTITLFLLRNTLNTKNENEIIEAAFSIQQTLKDENNVIARFETTIDIPWYVLFTVYEDAIETNEATILSTNDPLFPILPFTNEKPLFYSEKDYFLDGDLNLLYYTLEYENLIIQTAINTDLDTLSSFLDEVPFVLTLLAVPVLLISFLLARFLVKRTLKPVLNMTESAKKISFESSTSYLELRGSGDELDNLAQTFNNLFDSLRNEYFREKQFTSDVSHELKTPLSVILGNANLLRRWGKNDAVQLDKSIDVIISESKHIEHIITNLLQLSKLENVSAHIEQNTINLFDFLELLLLEIQEWAKVPIVIDCDDTIELETNEAMLRQVLIIFISNSIRYGGENVKIQISAKKQHDKLTLSIIDNGPGIDEKDLAHIFDRFYRADEARTRDIKKTLFEESGSGLGLSIAKALVSALGGTIQAKSPLEDGKKGTEMIVQIPL